MDFDEIYENYFLDNDIWKNWTQSDIEQIFLDENIEYTQKELIDFTEYLTEALESSRRIAKDDYKEDLKYYIDEAISKVEHLNNIEIAAILVEHANIYLNENYY